MSLMKLLKFSLITILLFCPLILGSQNATTQNAMTQDAMTQNAMSQIAMIQNAMNQDEKKKKCVDSCSQSKSLLDNAINSLIKARDTYNCTDCGPELEPPRDCFDILNAGIKNNGIYKIYPISRALNGKPIKVFCDMESDGGGWTVVQRRGNYQRAIDYFYRNWQDYKEGFGDLDQDFWLGNDKIYAISNQKKYSARFDLHAVGGHHRHAHYDDFWIEDESRKYTLHIQDYRGSAGDSMSAHDGMMFSTKDQRNDNGTQLESCAVASKGAWWYRDDRCAESNLNGQYFKGSHRSQGDGVNWNAFKGLNESLEKTEIKLKPKPKTSKK